MALGAGKENNRKRFGFHPGTPETIPIHDNVRCAFIAFADILDEILRGADGDAAKTAFDKLQEASMWSNFAVCLKAPVVLPQYPTDPEDVPGISQ